jgi:predicted enzyme related to lactoylglutathione lyase
MNAVSWFEIPVRDLTRARAFYTKVLGHALQDLPSPLPGVEMAAFPWEQNAVHAAGALVKGEGRVPRGDGVLVYFQCKEDLSVELGRVEANGGKILMPKVSIGPWGFIAHVLDSEGNRVGLASTK